MNRSVNNNQKSPLKVAIIGGGPVGSLAACFLGQRGYEVDLFEYRADVRSNEIYKGSVINLSLSRRGRRALAKVGLEEKVAGNRGIPMYARMIHELDGTTREDPYDARTNQCLYSLDRKYLNQVLLSAAEKYENVHLHFNHKLIDTNLEKGQVTISNNKTNQIIEKTYDLVIGADGAFSAVRGQMVKQPLFDFNQTYIEHGFLAFLIPPTKEGKFAMPPSCLHMWPRGKSMLFGFPNVDCSFTVVLFMPFIEYEKLNTSDKLVIFFESHFPDLIPLIGKDEIINNIFGVKLSPVVTVKCFPYHSGDKVLIIGDAAHAMVPFYGQGMNAGFEDCYLLDQLLNYDEANLENILEHFSNIRKKDAHAICDLAMYNYMELSKAITTPTYKLRKKLDNFLFKVFPKTWIPLYNSVCFTDMGYENCMKNRQWQDQVVQWSLGTLAAVGLTTASIVAHAIYLSNV